MGYSRAGFTEIVGIDLKPQPRYPFRFIQADAMRPPVRLEDFDAIHASPPCQGYSIMRNLPWLRDREYPMLIPAVRDMLRASGREWVIENVAGARKSEKHPDGLQAGWLCGQSFGLSIYRHRYFETSFLWLAPPHQPHEGVIRSGRMLGDRAREPVKARKTGQRYGFDRPGTGVGHSANGRGRAATAIGVEWMNRSEASQAIPPVFTEFIGRQLIAAIERAA